MYKYFCIIAFILSSCSTSKNQQHIGIWELEGFKIDQFPYSFQPTFIQFNKNSSFAVAQTKKDQVGIYSLGSGKINFQSGDDIWFNNTWNFFINDDFLSLTGKDQLNRNSELKFRKVNNVPDYQEFEDRIIGSWELYKVRQNGDFEMLSNTWMNITDANSYHITNRQGIMENGKISIDTRHQKMFFESDQSSWKAWFYGHELRLNNKKAGLQYSLRKKEITP